jgi:hypothetical protein
MILVGIMVLALWLRLWGLGFGLPHRYHIDEPPHVLAALRIAQGQLQIDYPPLSPNLHQVLLLFLFAGLFVFLKLSGAVTGPGEFAALYQRDPTAFYLLARGLSVVCSLLALVALYLLVRKVRERRIAVLACFFLALCFLDVRHAHFAKMYTLLTLLVLICVYLSLIYARRGDQGFLIASGIVCGVIIGLRFSLSPIGLVPLAAIVLRIIGDDRSGRVKRFLSRMGHLVWAVPLGILIGAPALIFNTQYSLRRIGIWAHHAVATEGFLGFQFTTMPTWQLYAYLLRIAWGMPLVLLMLLGLIRVLVRHRREDLHLFLFPVSYLIVLLLASSASSAFARYVVPILPFLALLAAEGTLALGSRLFGEFPTHIMHAGLGVLAVALVAPPCARIVRLDWLWMQTDTRTLAKTWIETNVPEGTKIAGQWHGPPLATQSDPEPRSLRTYDVTILNPFASDARLYSTDYYQENGFEYLILSSFIYKLKRMDPVEDARRCAFYEALEQDQDLVAEFKPYTEDEEPPFFFEQMWSPMTNLWSFHRPGPTIKIYELEGTDH